MIGSMSPDMDFFTSLEEKSTFSTDKAYPTDTREKSLSGPDIFLAKNILNELRREEI